MVPLEDFTYTSQILGMSPESLLRLQLHAIDAPVAIEIVDVEGAERALQSRVDVIHADAEQFRLLHVDADVDARNLRGIGGAYANHLRPLGRRGDQLLGHRLELRIVAPAARLHERLEAPGVR